MFLLAFVVGVGGGTYGIGGGAIIAPFCVSAFHLPVYTAEGAALFGTFLTSIAGVVFYSTLPTAKGLFVSPDWALGFLFGIGGFVGMYIGARLQKFIPQIHQGHARDHDCISGVQVYLAVFHALGIPTNDEKIGVDYIEGIIMLRRGKMITGNCWMGFNDTGNPLGHRQLPRD